jgi:hypothetical protein
VDIPNQMTYYQLHCMRKKKIDKLIEQKHDLSAQISKLQSKCSHENVKGSTGANTGNLCEQDNKYWLNVTCLDCHKVMWIDFDTDRELYNKFYGKCRN